MINSLEYVEEKSKNTLKERVEMNYRSEKRLSRQICEKAWVLPGRTEEGVCRGGVLDTDKNFIEASAWHEGPVGGGYLPEVKDSTWRIDEKVIYIGYFHSIWGHVLTDCLKKCWFLLSDEGQQLLQDGWQVVYVSMHNQPLPKRCFELFELLGVQPEKWERITVPTCFGKVLVPDNSFFMTEKGRFFTKEYLDTIAVIKHNVMLAVPAETKTYDKLYFTRTGLKDNRDIGEAAIEREFQNKGFEVFSPEKLDMKQQIYLLMNCRIFAGTEGSITHNAVFCRPGTQIAIVRKADYVNDYQMAINDTGDFLVNWIDGNYTIPANPAAAWGGPFYLYVTPFVKAYLESHTRVLPHMLNPRYWMYAAKMKAARMRGR